MKNIFILSLFVIYILISCNNNKQLTVSSNEKNIDNFMQENKDSLPKTEEEWLKKLGSEAYGVLRQKGTERPYTGTYENHWDSGTYVCKGCNAPLFTSATKFDAGCGWPSFYKSIDSTKVKEIIDMSHGMSRIEVVCANCGGHLGHVFDDGPEPTGLRYCINSISLGFKLQTR